MSARRSLLTATAAGTLLGALWFVPSAKATDDLPAQHRTRTAATTVVRTAAHTSSGASEVSRASRASRTSELSRTSAESAAGTAAATGGTPDGPRTRLADTGSFDTTPYVAGGTVFLTLGAGFVVYSIRRERMAG